MHAAIMRERRWLVIADDGRHVTVGRHTDPTPEELEVASARLVRLGLGGWLAVSEGGYYEGQPVSLMVVCRLAPGAETWEEVAARWVRLRAEANY